MRVIHAGFVKCEQAREVLRSHFGADGTNRAVEYVTKRCLHLQFRLRTPIELPTMLWAVRCQSALLQHMTDGMDRMDGSVHDAISILRDTQTTPSILRVQYDFNIQSLPPQVAASPFSRVVYARHYMKRLFKDRFLTWHDVMNNGAHSKHDDRLPSWMLDVNMMDVVT